MTATPAFRLAAIAEAVFARQSCLSTWAADPEKAKTPSCWTRPFW
jgi:hypothetical protein